MGALWCIAVERSAPISSMDDRLYHLSGYRLALRHNLFTTPESVLTASPTRLADLRQCRGEILRIVRAGNPDVLRALFLPQVPLDWSVAGLQSHPGARILSVSIGSKMVVKEQLVQLIYRVDDDGSDERRAWIALRDALRVGVTKLPSQAFDKASSGELAAEYSQ